MPCNGAGLAGVGAFSGNDHSPVGAFNALVVFAVEVQVKDKVFEWVMGVLPFGFDALVVECPQIDGVFECCWFGRV